MCFSQFAQYAPRPVYQYDVPERPEDAPLTKADLDENLYGPKPLPPQWQKPVIHDHGHLHEAPQQNGNGAAAAVTAGAAVQVAQSQANGSAAVASVTTQTVEAVVVELSNGTKLLICPL